MTTFREIDVRCAVCGTAARRAVLSSTSSFGPPDLDLRPREPARSALLFEIQRCDGCGYCAPSIGRAPETARETVGSVAYREVLEQSSLPSLGRSYFCAALVQEAAGAHEESAWAFLRAAWACDDARAKEAARSCRERAAELFRRALQGGEAEMPEAVVLTLTADLWRRAGRFDAALAVAARVEHLVAAGEPDEPDEDAAATAVVAAYIRALAEAGDDGPHDVSEAFAAHG